ncbi:hypothetical protein JCM11641_001468 [Rhodosporidiobolus odoratus]
MSTPKPSLSIITESVVLDVPAPTFTGAPLFPLPSAETIHLAPNVQLQPPLTRCGKGPGLLIVVPSLCSAADVNLAEVNEANLPETISSKSLDPPPLQKWAEEGYCVLQLEYKAESEVNEAEWGIEKVLEEGVETLKGRVECTGKRLGLIVYEPAVLDKLLLGILSYPSFCCLVTYGSSWEEPSIPTLQHLPANDPKAASVANTLVDDGTVETGQKNATHGSGTATPAVPIKSFLYPCDSPYFPLPNRAGETEKEYSSHAAAVAHSRTLEFLKMPQLLSGPVFALETLWEEHCYYEFEERKVDKIMAAEPYVNHVPTMAGGAGRTALTAFYRDHFVNCNPIDTQLHLVSRTIGIDRVVDEFVATLTHDQEIDWLLPGVPPTGKHLEIPTVAIVCFRGDRLCSEHIHWDQATVLKQLDLLTSHFPCPSSASPASSSSSGGVQPLIRLPVCGKEAAQKLVGGEGGVVGGQRPGNKEKDDKEKEDK